MQPPKFTLNDVKYADDPAMFARAEQLHKSGKVKQVKEIAFGRGYSGRVEGGSTYEVSISARRIDEADCTCYMGQNDMLCKHMLALGLAVLEKTVGLNSAPAPKDLSEVKKQVSDGMRKIRGYTGPSRVWFTYQRGLSTGAGMISEAIGNLDVSKEHADYLWSVVRRLRTKLARGGVDDSNGTVGDCVYGIIIRLRDFVKDSPELKPLVLKYCEDYTGFGFEDELRNLLS